MSSVAQITNMTSALKRCAISTINCSSSRNSSSPFIAIPTRQLSSAAYFHHRRVTTGTTGTTPHSHSKCHLSKLKLSTIDTQAIQATQATQSRSRQQSPSSCIHNNNNLFTTPLTITTTPAATTYTRRSIHTHSFNPPPPPPFFPVAPPSHRNKRIMSAFPELSPYFAGNQQWAATTNAAEPEFLPTLAQHQAPPVFWFGCCDSRVPETTVMSRRPGDVFVHRNIANQFQKDDTSANAALNYSVLHVGVQHVAVVGHSSCGGCNAAFAAPPPSGKVAADANPLGAFLTPLIEIRHKLPASATANDLVVENVRQSVKNICESATMKTAWAQGKNVVVHGWHYDLQTGLLTDLGFSQGPQ